jgi:phosphatidylinositol glycan class S
VDLSEEAFFDANMLGLLYFPDEHKYAIYALPFAPIFVQMFTGIWQEYKSRQQKQRKLKSE